MGAVHRYCSSKALLGLVGRRQPKQYSAEHDQGPVANAFCNSLTIVPCGPGVTSLRIFQIALTLKSERTCLLRRHESPGGLKRRCRLRITTQLAQRMTVPGPNNAVH